MEPIESKNSKGFDDSNLEIITVKNVRVLRPWEARLLTDAIPKREQRINWETLLYSGMRYVEGNRLLENPKMFEPGNRRIHLDSYAIRKKKIKMKERYVILNPTAVRIVEDFIDQNNFLPDYKTWGQNLKRWANYANINSDKLGPKTSRKTLESWLVTYYPHYTNHIFLSQGHNALTALNHYVTLPFNTKDKEEMKYFVSGWEP